MSKRKLNMTLYFSLYVLVRCPLFRVYHHRIAFSVSPWYVSNNSNMRMKTISSYIFYFSLRLCHLYISARKLWSHFFYPCVSFVCVKIYVFLNHIIFFHIVCRCSIKKNVRILFLAFLKWTIRVERINIVFSCRSWSRARARVHTVDGAHFN